jgi:hypothetical protein
MSMNKKDWVEGLLFAGFRLMAASIILLGGLSIVFQLLEAWHRFDPNYLGAFLAGTLLRPAILFLTGIVLHLMAGKLAHRMAAGFTRS